MPTVAVANLGCKVNQYEIERIAESFTSLGFILKDFRESADVYVVNTCSVTADADKKSRHIARKAARQNPNAKVVLTGCFAQLAIDTSENVEGAALLVPNSEKMRVASHVLESFPDLMQYSSSPAAQIHNNDDGQTEIAVFPENAPGGLISIEKAAHHRTRATLKIQDGCKYYCAFCSIPFTRNTMASRPLADVITEAKQLAEAGIKEVVVTGVCVGAYGPDTGSGGAYLADVLSAIAVIPGVDRVRLSSVQPVEIPDQVIEAMAAHPTIAPHLHLSLQSGDDTILRAMNRPYDTHYFADKVAKLRESIPEIGITTDLIVGFPGETEELFDNTVRFTERMGFARTHVFRYSPRRRTAAASMKDDISFEEKERRHRILTGVCLNSQQQFAAAHINMVVNVLVEARGAKDNWVSGYTRNYVRVQFEAPKTLRGKIVPVRVTNVLPEGDAFGEMAR